MFLEEIFISITAGKLGLGLLIFYVKKMCADKLANLGFIHRE